MVTTIVYLIKNSWPGEESSRVHIVNSKFFSNSLLFQVLLYKVENQKKNFPCIKKSPWDQKIVYKNSFWKNFMWVACVRSLTPGNNFHYFLITPHGKEFAQLKPRLGILVYESNEEQIIQTGNCNSIEIF